MRLYSFCPYIVCLMGLKKNDVRGENENRRGKLRKIIKMQKRMKNWIDLK